MIFVLENETNDFNVNINYLLYKTEERVNYSFENYMRNVDYVRPPQVLTEKKLRNTQNNTEINFWNTQNIFESYIQITSNS